MSSTFWVTSLKQADRLHRASGRHLKQNPPVAVPPDPRSNPGPGSPADGRALRFEQSIVAIALLAGFVFKVPWLIPAVAVVLAVAAVAGPAGNALARLYDVLFGTTIGADGSGETIELARLTRLVEVVLLAVGSVLVVLGGYGLAWVFGLPVAGITAVAATTGINLVAVVLDRSGRRGH